VDAVWKSKAIITDFGKDRNANSICSLALLSRKQTWDLTFLEKYEEIVLNTPGIL
jgi:hypothetical protein